MPALQHPTITLKAKPWQWLAPLALLLGVLSPAQGQAPLCYGTSSATLSANTVHRLDTSSGSDTLLYTANGSQANRCTALGLEPGKLFLLDAASLGLWSLNLDGTGLTALRNGLTPAPLSLALDVANQKVYYASSSATQSGNLLQRVDYSGLNHTVLFSATGASGNGVRRCTAVALDPVHSKLFLADAGGNALWSLNLDGSGLALVTSGLAAAPLDLALDMVNSQIYFVTSSANTSGNSVGRVDYAGTGLTNLLTAGSGNSVQRCTAITLDLPNSTIYLADAGANVLWRLPLAGGTPSSLASGLGSGKVRSLRLLAKITPTIVAWPTASPILLGWALSASRLTGGSAAWGTNALAGDFTFAEPWFLPPAGPCAAPVLFTPADTASFSVVTNTVTVAVLDPQTALSVTANSDVGNVTVSWPASQTGWALQWQTNSVNGGLGTNWTLVPAAQWTNRFAFPMTNSPCAFFRLAFPYKN